MILASVAHNSARQNVNINRMMFSMGQGNVFTCAQNKETCFVSNYDKIGHQKECFAGPEVRIWALEGVICVYTVG